MHKGDIEPWQGMTITVLPDGLVVEILSRLPLKSFCRFKCVCKSWLSFSSDPQYRHKRPRTPVGLLYQKLGHGNAIDLARLPSSDMDIDTALSFVPCYEHPLEILGCSNGLLLGDGIVSEDEEITETIVCNPATQELTALPYAEPGSAASHINLRLCFDPLWSQHFYVFKFEASRIPAPDYGTLTEVKVFSSKDSTWSGCLWETEDAFCNESIFVNGVLYVMHFEEKKILALDAPNTSAQLLNHRIIQLPGFATRTDTFNCCDGCLSQSSGILCYAKQELDGCAVRIWSLDIPDEWVVKHRVRMTDVFERDMLISRDGFWRFDYDILGFDMERELVILNDNKADKIISVSISTGKGSQFLKIPEKFTELYHSLFYVPYYGQVPALAR